VERRDWGEGIGFWTLEDATDMFSRNVCNCLPNYAALTPIRVKIFMKKLTRWSDKEIAERTANDTIRN
jgi:hypothetical protein